MDIKKQMTAATNGIWVYWDEVEVLLKSSSKLFITIRENSTIDGKINEYELAKQFAEHFVIDWRGITNDGVDFPCTPENKKLLFDCSLKFYQFIISAVANFDTLKEVEIKN